MKKISIQNMDGTMEEVDLLNSFIINDINRHFVILSKVENAGEGMCKIYVSEAIEMSPGVYKLVGIEDNTVWQKVKEAMKQIVES